MSHSVREPNLILSGDTTGVSFETVPDLFGLSLIKPGRINLREFDSFPVFADTTHFPSVDKYLVDARFLYAGVTVWITDNVNLLDHAYSYPFVEPDICLSKVGDMDWVQAIFLAC